MDIADFWTLIEETRAASGYDACEQVESLVPQLCRLPLEEIRSFSRWWYLVTNEGHTWDLVGAAYILDGYVSNDHFDYFRPWLMLHGRDVWETAVADVEDLADIPIRFVDGWAQLEDALYVAVRAYEQVTGRDDGLYEDMAEYREERRRLAQAPLRGVPLPDTDEEYARRWPRLWNRYASRPHRLDFMRRLERAVDPGHPPS